MEKKNFFFPLYYRIKHHRLSPLRFLVEDRLSFLVFVLSNHKRFSPPPPLPFLLLPPSNNKGGVRLDQRRRGGARLDI